jgi:hypothetical protein
MWLRRERRPECISVFTYAVLFSRDERDKFPFLEGTENERTAHYLGGESLVGSRFNRPRPPGSSIGVKRSASKRRQSARENCAENIDRWGGREGPTLRVGGSKRSSKTGGARPGLPVPIVAHCAPPPLPHDPTTPLAHNGPPQPFFLSRRSHAAGPDKDPGLDAVAICCAPPLSGAG